MKSALLVTAVGCLAVAGCTNTSMSTPSPVQGTAATVAPAVNVPTTSTAATAPQGPAPEQIAARPGAGDAAMPARPGTP